MKIIPRDYQLAGAEHHYKCLKEHLITYLAWQERTGKSLTAILACEMTTVADVLIVTKNKAVEGWKTTIADYEPIKNYAIVTYGSLHKYKGNPGIVIIDEAHNYISGYPKPSSTWLKLRKITMGKPIIFCSATPHAQGYQMLYHQFALSDWSPWRLYSNFYNWFKTYGVVHEIKINDRWISQYDTTQEKLISATVAHLFDYKTRKELGFEYEPTDELHYITLSDSTKELYNDIVKNKLLVHDNRPILCDTGIKLRFTLHMLEGGTIKNSIYGMDCSNVDHLGDKPVKLTHERIADAVICHAYYILDNNEKLDYIRSTWGDSENLCIMYNYIAEAYKLKKNFKQAKILQATSYAEGIDLSHVKDLVVYSQDFSTARHVQRRARQASKSRAEPIKVHFLLVKKAISEQVYKTVAINQKNFVDSTFTRETI